jgi:hypothetical protein
MSMRSLSLPSVLKSGLSLSRTSGRAGPSRLLSTTSSTENRPSPSQSLGAIFDEAWGPNSPLGSSTLGLPSHEMKELKDDLRAAGVSPSIVNTPVHREVDSTGRPLYKPGYTATARPPRVDPLLDLFTNLIMKHGRKAEAQKRVGEILDIM